MNVVDFSGWLEYFADGPNAGFFAPAISKVDQLIVPSICLLEVCRRVLIQRGIEDAMQAAALMQVGRVVDLDTGLALLAAQIGVALKLALADSVVLATARAHNAVLWTQDQDFDGLDGVRYIARKQEEDR